MKKKIILAIMSIIPIALALYVFYNIPFFIERYRNTSSIFSRTIALIIVIPPAVISIVAAFLFYLASSIAKIRPFLIYFLSISVYVFIILFGFF